MAGLDAEIREELDDELAAHGRPAVGVNRELMRTDALLGTRRRDQALRQARTLRHGNHPAHDVPTEEVEDHVQRVIEVRDGPLQLGDVPCPYLIRRRRDQLGLRVHRMPRLIAPLPDFVRGGEHAIHRAHRPEILLLLEQGGMDFGGRLIDKSLAVQRVQNGLAFTGGQRARRRRAG